MSAPIPPRRRGRCKVFSINLNHIVARLQAREHVLAAVVRVGIPQVDIRAGSGTPVKIYQYMINACFARIAPTVAVRIAEHQVANGANLRVAGLGQ